MISDKSYSNIPLYFCLFCSILNMAQYVWIQCASTSCRIHIFVSSIVLNILFCHPKELNLLLNLCQSFLGAGNLSDRLESKKKFCFWVLGESGFTGAYFNYPKKRHWDQNTHWDPSAKSKVLGMQILTLLRSRSGKWCLLPWSHSYGGKQLEVKRSQHMAGVTSREVSVASSTIQNRLPLPLVIS